MAGLEIKNANKFKKYFKNFDKKFLFMSEGYI